METFSSSSKRSRVSCLVESPQITLWLPRVMISPSLVLGFLIFFSSLSTSNESSFTSLSSSQNLASWTSSKPTSLRRSRSKDFNKSKSQSPPKALLAMRYAFDSFSVSLRFGTRTSTSSLPRPRSCMAFMR